jgi:hypothetical protein
MSENKGAQPGWLWHLMVLTIGFAVGMEPDRFSGRTRVAGIRDEKFTMQSRPLERASTTLISLASRHFS